MNKRELWEKVKLAIDRAKKFVDEQHAAKVIAGGGIGALVGKKVTGDNRGVTSGAIIGALAALAHNNRINSKRIEGGQDYLAQGQQMQTRGRSYNYPQIMIEEFRDAARSKYASALMKIAYVGPKVHFTQNELVPGFGSLIDKGDPCVFMGKKYKTPAEADIARIKLRRGGFAAKILNEKLREKIYRNTSSGVIGKTSPGVKIPKIKGRNVLGALIGTSVPIVSSAIKNNSK